MAFYENGDAAPGGRFAFVFDSTATGEGKANANANEINGFAAFIESLRNRFCSAYADFRKLLNYYLF